MVGIECIRKVKVVLKTKNINKQHTFFPKNELHNNSYRYNHTHAHRFPDQMEALLLIVNLKKEK